MIDYIVLFSAVFTDYATLFFALVSYFIGYLLHKVWQLHQDTKYLKTELRLLYLQFWMSGPYRPAKDTRSDQTKLDDAVTYLEETSSIKLDKNHLKDLFMYYGVEQDLAIGKFIGTHRRLPEIGEL